jgi:predicted ATPase
MIKSVWVKNYRSIADIRVNLEPVTILVGHNGSGKSNFVDVFRFIYDAFRLGLDAAIASRDGMSTLRRWSAKGRPYDVEIGFTLETDAFTGTYSFILGGERRGEYTVKREQCIIKESATEQEVRYETNNGVWVYAPKNVSPSLTNRTLVFPLLATTQPYTMLYNYVTSFAFYNISPNAMAGPQKPANPYPLDEQGSNFASTLREMQRTNRSRMELLRESLNAALPDVVDFQVSQVGGYLVTRLKHKMPNHEQATFDLFQESNGTLRLLGILVALHQDDQHTLLALEEPELTIHPGALGVLWDEIEAVSDRSQVFITTHSPDLLDMCRVDQLRVVEKIEGITLINSIEETQRIAIKEHLFAPGELMRAQGLRRSEQVTLLEP